MIATAGKDDEAHLHITFFLFLNYTGNLINNRFIQLEFPFSYFIDEKVGKKNWLIQMKPISNK